MDVLKHREEELLNWLPTQTTPQLFHFLSIDQPIDLSIQRSISFLLVNWLIDQINQLIKFPAPSDQSVITSCSKIWSLADLLVWSWINRLITSRLISCSNLFLLPRCRLRPLRLSAITKNCVRPSQSPLVDRLTISTVHFHFFQQICSLRKGKWWDSIAIRLLNQLKISFFIQLKFNLLIGNPQRWPCGALFCRLLVETRNSSTTEWYTCLNNQKITLFFLLLICIDQQWWIADQKNKRYMWGYAR